jgi:hypothetical protein
MASTALNREPQVVFEAVERLKSQKEILLAARASLVVLNF